MARPSAHPSHSTEPAMPPINNPAARLPTHRTGALLAIGLALCLIGAPGEADAKSAKKGKTGTSEPAKKKGVSKVTYQRSTSEESTAERDRRMYRECKGLHNAGACRGNTR